MNNFITLILAVFTPQLIFYCIKLCNEIRFILFFGGIYLSFRSGRHDLYLREFILNENI